VGRYEARRRDEKGGAAVHTGTFLTIWKKQVDGSWKVVLDTGVEDPPTAVASAH
jgi:ketosteroid isomerase-like protein